MENRLSRKIEKLLHYRSMVEQGFEGYLQKKCAFFYANMHKVLRSVHKFSTLYWNGYLQKRLAFKWYAGCHLFWFRVVWNPRKKLKPSSVYLPSCSCLLICEVLSYDKCQLMRLYLILLRLSSQFNLSRTERDVHVCCGLGFCWLRSHNLEVFKAINVSTQLTIITFPSH